MAIPTGGAGQIPGAVAQTRRTSGSFDERRRTTYSIGYDYDLSRRTNLYAFLLSDKITSFENAQSLAVGVRHRF